MPLSPATERLGFRRKLSQRLNGLFRRSRPSSSGHGDHTSGETPATLKDPTDKPNDTADTTVRTENVIAKVSIEQSVPHETTEEKLSTSITISDAVERYDLAGPDIWSAAFREAVETLGKDLNTAIFKSSTVEGLFRELEEMDQTAIHESSFSRGLKCLQSIQVPLERFKLALDLASPLTCLEPTATTVSGVLRSVTAIAISLANSDLEFTRKIGEMLEQLAYIDDCDTLGQKSDKQDIQKALVPVYQKLLEFYDVSVKILQKRGTRLAMAIVLDDQTLPEIVKDFLRHAETLHKLVQKATWEIVEDIKNMLYDREISRWLGSEKTTGQSRYHTDLRDLRADEACQFLLNHRYFNAWYCALSSRQLALFGRMGSGKSVTTAFVADELTRRSRHQLPQPKVCYCYCRDEETSKALYVFSALLLELLQQLPGLKKSFYDWYRFNQANGNSDPASDLQKLLSFFYNVVETLDRPLFILVDGLDECSRASRTSILQALRSMLQKSNKCKIMISCRPSKEIIQQLDEGAVQIELISDEVRDHIIVEHTVKRRLFYLDENVRELIINTLAQMSQGSAIWTKMVIEFIEVRGITAYYPMQHFLHELPLPPQLYGLYDALLLRCTSGDTENLELAGMALKLLASARRPLSILELAWATTLATIGQKITAIAALSNMVDHQRILNLIQPFITGVDFNDTKKRQVQFTHQSVKEFTESRYVSSQTNNRASAPSDANFVSEPITQLEACMLDVCINYLLLEEINVTNLFSDTQMAIDALPQEADLFRDNEGPVEYNPYCTWDVWEEDMIHYDPTERGFGDFFVYASSYWVEHYGASGTEAISRMERIENLCQARSMRLYNWIEQNRRPGCAIKARFDFHYELHDPLSITSLFGSEEMLRHMLEVSDFNKEKYLPSSIEGAAEQIMKGLDFSKLKILFLDPKHGHRVQNLYFFTLIMWYWSDKTIRHLDWDAAFDLIHHASDKMIVEQWDRELLDLAIKRGCEPIIQRLNREVHHKENPQSD